MFSINEGTTTVNPDYKTQGKQIVKLKELVGKKVRIWGYLITKDVGYGKGVLLCGDSELISLPKRYLEGFQSSSEQDRKNVITGDYYIYNIRETDAKLGKTVVFDMGNNEDYMRFLEDSNK